MAGADLEYQQALEQHRAGDLAAAREGYLRVLQLEPGHTGAMHRLGNLDLRVGRLDDAERLIRRAIELAPESSGFHNSLGNVLLARGDHDAALSAYREEIRQRPDFAVSYHQIGLLRMSQGQLQDALQSVQKAVFHAPRFAAAYNTLGRIYNNLGQLDEAQHALNRALHFQPNFAEAVYNLAHLTRRRGDTETAIQLFERAIQQDPRWQAAHRQLGMLMLEVGKPVVALGHFEQALTLDANDPVAHYGMGLIFQNRAMLDAARRHFRRAVQLAPGYADALCNLGAVERSLGQLDDAVACFRRALNHEPEMVPALAGLAGVLEMRGDYDQALEQLLPHITTAMAPPELLVTYATVLQRLERGSEAIDVLEKHSLRADLNEFDRMVLQFKLGDLLDRGQRYAEAWERFRTANAARKTDFDPKRYDAVATRIIKAYDTTALKRLPRSANDSTLPVFIVGMPRSGTSLVEQIIASHPAAAGAGELAMIGFQALGLASTLKTKTPYPECIAQIDTGTLNQLSEQYIERLRSLAPDAQRVTDKMWQNYENLGFIELLFPKARIIHCMRDPRDSLLSCYFQLFGAGGIPFSYKPEHLAATWHSYKKLMQHWRASLRLPILEVRYEQLVADPKAQIPRIVEFLQLPWDEACLNFHETRRAVTTASYDQVRQPMYTGSVGRYTHYKEWLKPFFGDLEAF